MFKKIMFSFICLSIAACSNVAQNTRIEGNDKSKEIEVVWEQKPRSVVSGSGGQLWVRASEGMNLLYAAHGEKGTSNVYLAKSKDVGDSFGHAVKANSEKGKVSSHGENGPQLRMGNGIEIFAAWIENRDVRFARSVNFGRSFLPSMRVNDDEGKAAQSFHTMEASPDGTIFVSWLDGRDSGKGAPGTSSIYLARSQDKGKTFGKNIRVAGDICPCCRPAIAFGNSGQVFVSWRHVYPGNVRKIVVASSSDNGSTWSKPVPVEEKGWKINGCAHSGPTMKYVDGKLFLVWYTGAEEKASLKMAWSADDGKSFTSLGDIQDKVLDPNHPHLAVIMGEPWIIFQGRDSNKKGGWAPAQAWTVKLSKEGKVSIPQAIPSDGQGVFYPYLFKGNGGRVYALWTALTDNGPKVMMSRGRLKS